MYRFYSIKYLVTTALITAILLAFGYASTFIFIPGIKGLGYLQLADIIALPLTSFIPGPMLLIANSIAMVGSDLIGGYLIFIPATILTRLLMFLIIRILEPYFHFIITYLFAVLPLILIYPPYTYLVSNFDDTAGLAALVTDIVQAITTYLFAIFVNWFLIRINKISLQKLWDDSQFNDLKGLQAKK